jgi:hypothetical protein
MIKNCVFLAVRTGFLNIIHTSFSFKGLREYKTSRIRGLTIHEYRRTIRVMVPVTRGAVPQIHPCGKPILIPVHAL